MKVLYKAIIKKLERLCKEKIWRCQSKGHLNSEVIRGYNPDDKISAVYFRCNECGTVFARNATEEDKLQYWSNQRPRIVMDLQEHNYKNNIL